MPDKEAVLPKELPKEPSGWTKKMIIHMNFGAKGGSAAFEVCNPAGEVMPIGYQYDTRKGGQTGFSLPGIDPLMTWPELCEMWPTWLKKHEKAVSAP